MAQYLLYCRSGQGEPVNAKLFDAKDDADAVHLVTEMNLPVGCEIWDHSRFVAGILPHVERAIPEQAPT